MAKERTPVGKHLIQQNLISIYLIKLLNHFHYENLDKLKKFTLGRLIIATELVLPPTEKNSKFIKYLHEYNILRNGVVHNLNLSTYPDNSQNEIFHKIKSVNRIGNIILGKMESLFIKNKII